MDKYPDRINAYMHTLRDGRETLTFEDALEQEPERREKGYQPLWWYRELGRYSRQVEEPHPIKEALKPFLPKFIRQKLGQQAKTLTLRKETMNPEPREELRQYFREDVEKLQGLINRDLSTWLNDVTN